MVFKFSQFKSSNPELILCFSASLSMLSSVRNYMGNELVFDPN
jgi:hypothetical protein